MYRYLPLILLLAASAYAQGTPVRPVAPPFNPITDSPHRVGQPGHLQPQQLPRSPHKRVLPPTKEPGIWASDAGYKSRTEDKRRLMDGYVLPVPLELEPAEDDRAGSCGRALASALTKSSYDQLQRLPETARFCTYAKLYARCAESGVFKAKKFAASNADTERVAWWTKVLNTARREVAMRCAAPDDDKDASDWIGGEGPGLMRNISKAVES